MIRSSIPTVHSSDAVDYSDFNEAVPDDPMFSEKYFRKGMGVVQKNLPRSRLSLVTENYDDEEENEVEEQQKIKVEQELPTLYTEDQKQRQIDVKQLFPGFEQGKVLKFSELFMTRIQRPPKLQSNKRGIEDIVSRSIFIHYLFSHLW